MKFTLLAIALLSINSASWAQGIAPDSARVDSVAVRPVEEIPPGAHDTTTFSFRDTDLRDIFRALSHQHSLNLFLDNSIQKKSTIALSKVRVWDAIQFLCREHGLVLALEGGIVKVSPPPPAPPPVPPPPKVPIVSFENGLLSVILKEDDLERTVLEIQQKAKKNILLISGTTGTLSGKLIEIDFDKGFTQLLNNNGFALQMRNGIYVVSRLDHFVGTQGTATKERSGPYWVSVKDSLVTIDVTSAPLERVLHDMIRQLNTDVVFLNAITGNVTARATSQKLSRALDLVLRSTNYGYRESEGIYFVGEKANKALVTSRLMRLKYLTSDGLPDLIPQSLSSQATIKVMKEQNGIIVTAASDILAQMEELLAEIDRPVPQVLIEALVVDYDLTRGSEFGIEAGFSGNPDSIGSSRSGSIIPGIDLATSGAYLNDRLGRIGTQKIFGSDFDFGKLGKLPVDFYLNLKAMESKGIANVRSRPILATLNGHKATLSIGTTQYFLLKTTVPYRDQTSVLFQESQTFQTIEADVKLEITPYVGTDSLITVEIKPDFRIPVGAFNSTVPPTINRRALSSTLVVRQGETIVLGGLIEEGETETRSQVPLLGSIPLIGELFSSTTKSKRKTELLIYVTPHVSYGEAFKFARKEGE